jgi:hypothetical protein
VHEISRQAGHQEGEIVTVRRRPFGRDRPRGRTQADGAFRPGHDRDRLLGDERAAAVCSHTRCGFADLAGTRANAAAGESGGLHGRPSAVAVSRLARGRFAAMGGSALPFIPRGVRRP